MSATTKLPKWVSLLLVLFIGMMVTFGGQLFFGQLFPARANPYQNKVAQPTSCQLEPSTATNTTTLTLSTAIQNKAIDAGLVILLQQQKGAPAATGTATLFKLKCQ